MATIAFAIGAIHLFAVERLHVTASPTTLHLSALRVDEADCSRLSIAGLEEKLVDNRQWTDHANFRGPWMPLDSFQFRVADDVPFAHIWRVMVTAACSGYLKVHLTRGGDDGANAAAHDG